MSQPVIPEMFRSAAAQVREQGWVIEATDGDHLRWISPDGAVVTSAKTPSDSRALPRHVSKLRQAGAVIDGRGAAPRPRPKPAPEPSPEPEPETASPVSTEVADELRELIREARAVLGDLQRERKAAAEIVATGLQSLVGAELYRLLHEPDGVYQAEMRELHAETASRVAEVVGKFERDGQQAIRSFRARLAEVNELIKALSVRSSLGLDRPAVPPAFRKPPPSGGNDSQR
jgi:hypothetical protein